MFKFEPSIQYSVYLAIKVVDLVASNPIICLEGGKVTLPKCLKTDQADPDVGGVRGVDAGHCGQNKESIIKVDSRL